MPVLIVVFLSLAGSAALYHLTVAREEALQDKYNDLALISATVQAALETLSNNNGSVIPNEMQLRSRIPTVATSDGRFFAIINGQGKVLYTAPSIGTRPSDIKDVLSVPFRELNANSTFKARLASGAESIVSVRPAVLADGESAQVVAMHPLDSALAQWFRRMQSIGTLIITLSAVVAALGAAYYFQSARAQEADRLCTSMTDRIDTALSEARCGLWEWDIAHGQFFWSNSMFELVGLQGADGLLAFGEIADMMHPDDGDLFAIARRMLDEQISTLEQDFRMRHAAGGWVWLRARLQLAPETPVNKPRLIGVINDISEHKRLEEATSRAAADRLQADRRLADAVNSISEAFALCDRNGVLVLCNAKFRSFYQLSPEQVVVGRFYDELVRRPENSAANGLLLWSDGAGTHFYETEIANNRWLQVSERRTSDGGFVSVGTDITTHKEQESRLMESERQLIATVSDLRKSRHALQVKTVELAELADNYRDQRIAAEAASRTKTEFLANMSHELRTPLNAIIGFSEIMEKKLFGALGSDRYEEYVRNIHSSGAGLLAIIDDILEMSRIETGRMVIDPQPLPITHLIQTSANLFKSDAEAKGIRFYVHDQCEGEIQADERVMRHALAQLLRNAIKFTPVGGCAAIRARRTVQGINIFIEDTGVGIAPEHLERFGRPFELLGKALCNGNRGSGLGAAIARSLIELHGGCVRVRSSVGVGTIVMVHLPFEPPRTGVH